MAATTILDTATMPWDEQPSGLKVKLLQSNRDSGARTMILQSPPRAAGTSKPHRHNCSEEVFNLGPRMQFDKGQAIETGGFMLHPAGSVHGADIDLPEGYRLLVHTPARAVVEPVTAKQANGAHGPAPLIIVRPSEYRWEQHPGMGHSGAVMARLSWAGDEGGGSYLLKLPSGGECDLSHGGRALEVFVLRGAMQFHSGGRVEPEGFVIGHPGTVKALSVAGARSGALALVRL